jgi:hypothetical protein
MKTLNYSQKVHSVYSPVIITQAINIMCKSHLKCNLNPQVVFCSFFLCEWQLLSVIILVRGYIEISYFSSTAHGYLVKK